MFPEKNTKKKVENPVASISIPSYSTHRWDIKQLPKKVKVSRREAMEYYKSMQTIRMMEEKVDRLYKEGAISYFVHLYIGQEACAVGIEAAISRDDDVVGAYRTHGWAFTRGIALNKVFAEILGRSTGCGKGKGGSMHMYNHNFYGGNSIVGASVPIGAGVAFVHKYLKDGKVCVTCYGDGAANQGQVSETFNLAQVWKLPIVFVCENNGFGKSTAQERVTANPEFYTRGDRMPGIRADGMDVLAVREATKLAVNYALKCGPIILELMTYRFCGHSSNDPDIEYRSAAEVQRIKKARDPIKVLRKKLIKSKLASKDMLDYVDDEIRQLVEKEANVALSSSVPDISELGKDVYVTDKPIAIRSCNKYEKLHHAANI